MTSIAAAARRFAADGRVQHFEEWPYWPGRAYTASADPEPSPT